MADGMIWVVAKLRGQTPDRLWHESADGPFQIEAGLFSERWMRTADPAEVQEAMGQGAVPAGSAKDMAQMSDDELRAHYEVVMGEKSHHAAKRETLIDRITEKLNAD